MPSDCSDWPKPPISPSRALSRCCCRATTVDRLTCAASARATHSPYRWWPDASGCTSTARTAVPVASGITVAPGYCLGDCRGRSRAFGTGPSLWTNALAADHGRHLVGETEASRQPLLRSSLGLGSATTRCVMVRLCPAGLPRRVGSTSDTLIRSGSVPRRCLMFNVGLMAPSTAGCLRGIGTSPAIGGLIFERSLLRHSQPWTSMRSSA